MKTRTSDSRAPASAGSARPARPAERPRLLSRISHALGVKRAADSLTVEEAERRMRSRRSFLASLTPEQLAAIQEYDGPVICGRGGPKRKL
jgi:hypothetical protein